jgi:hypothetical protein
LKGRCRDEQFFEAAPRVFEGCLDGMLAPEPATFGGHGGGVWISVWPVPALAMTHLRHI